jgi:hypothetical protein
MDSVFRRFTFAACAALFLACTASPLSPAARAAQKKNEQAAPTAEAVAETVILVHGVRERLAQVRRSGIERGRVTRTTDDGRTEDITYERSFKRGATSEKDKIRLDQKRPSLEYSLVFNEGNIFGVVRGTPFTPRQEDVSTFLADAQHGIETLLRYKENGATLAYIGKEKLKGIETWILDLTDKEQRRTRYYISAQSGRVLWLEYEEKAPGATTSVKYKRSFHDYRTVQGTRVPYRMVHFADGKQIEELQVLSVVYGVKMEDAVFHNPESATAAP